MCTGKEHEPLRLHMPTNNLPMRTVAEAAVASICRTHQYDSYSLKSLARRSVTSQWTPLAKNEVEEHAYMGSLHSIQRVLTVCTQITFHMHTVQTTRVGPALGGLQPATAKMSAERLYYRSEAMCYLLPCSLQPLFSNQSTVHPV